jgi:co-chaperonin GroES (HSP10)
MKLLDVPIVKGHRILLEIEQIKNEIKTDKIVLRQEFLDQENNRGKLGCEIGRVVAIGPDAFVRRGATEPYCYPEDYVLFVQYSGVPYPHPNTKKTYRIVNEDDILAVIGTNERENNE